MTCASDQSSHNLISTCRKPTGKWKASKFTPRCHCFRIYHCICTFSGESFSDSLQWKQICRQEEGENKDLKVYIISFLVDELELSQSSALSLCLPFLHGRIRRSISLARCQIVDRDMLIYKSKILSQDPSYNSNLLQHLHRHLLNTADTGFP